MRLFGLALHSSKRAFLVPKAIPSISELFG
jgi:hypothetical protein